MRITWLMADMPNELNTSYHRAIFPAKMMQEAGHECVVSHVNASVCPPYLLKEKQVYIDVQKTFDAMKWADVVVIERLLVRPLHIVIKWLRAIGKQVWCTFDDAYHLMPAGVGDAFKTWRGGNDALNGRGDILGEFREGLKLCTGALVPSKVLQEDYRRYNPNIQFVPNFLYGKLWENLPPKDPDNIIIGWGGSSGHYESIRDSGIVPALGQLCRKYPRMYVHLQSSDQRILALFNKMGVRYRAFDWVKFEDWPKVVATFTVGIIPVSGAYDDRRSNLKQLENSIAGVPWVATNAPPYWDYRTGGILISNKPSEWARAIDKLITDKALYQKLSEEGRVWSREFNSQCSSTYERVFNLSCER